MGLNINIDNGGTLTDICVTVDGDTFKTKTLSTPYDLSKCFFDGLKKASSVVYGSENIARLLEEVDLIRYSTTQGTNAIVERKGPRLGLILSGDGDALVQSMAKQDPELFEALIGKRITTISEEDLDSEHAERVIVASINALTASGANRLIVSFSGSRAAEHETEFKKIALRKYPRHLLGAVPILFAKELNNDSDLTRNTWTAVINSFLHPAMESFLYNAEARLREFRVKNPLLIFRNDGDASRVAKTVAIKSYSSGPRGGMEGVRSFSKAYGLADVLSMDIGGTTTDIGHVVDHQVHEKRRGEVEGIQISFALSEVTSIGAGGSSILQVVDGAIMVGPESVGAVPGPACFGRGGTSATVTDVSLLLGIFDPVSYFGGTMLIDVERARAAVKANIADPLGIDVEDALFRVLDAYEAKIANELLKFPKISKATALLAFGGAGPLSGCGVAEKAGVDTVIVPKMAAVFSAYGIGSCNIGQNYCATLSEYSQQALQEVVDNMKLSASRDMFAEGVAAGDYNIDIRLVGQLGKQELKLPWKESTPLPAELKSADSIDVELSAVKLLRSESAAKGKAVKKGLAVPVGTRNLLGRDKKWRDIPVYNLISMSAGDHASGPAIVEEEFFTCPVAEGWSFTITDLGDIFLAKGK
jgi:N-methylhydantoinase A